MTWCAQTVDRDFYINSCENLKKKFATTTSLVLKLTLLEKKNLQFLFLFNAIQK